MRPAGELFPAALNSQFDYAIRDRETDASPQANLPLMYRGNERGILGIKRCLNLISPVEVPNR